MSKTIDRFNHVSYLYDKYRPKYNAIVLRDVSKYVGTNNESVMLDVGSGTGILTKQLTNFRFKSLYAVEPNDSMRIISERKFKKYAKVQHINGTSGTIPEIKKSSVDIIWSAQASHWFEPKETVKEFKRVLKPGGYIVFLSNSYGRGQNRAIKELMKNIRASTGYAPAKSEVYDTGAKTFSHEYHVFEGESKRNLSETQFIGNQCSISSSPGIGTDAHQKFVKGLVKIFKKDQTKGKLTDTIKTRAQIVQIN
jgi:ubiquinone/menaquinone biosynthesis C-methylase UbiE